MILRVLRRLLPPLTAEGRARRKLFSIRPGAGEIAIDCGANVGVVTDHLSKWGATVYAFEPNPFAFRALKERFANRPNVHCIEKGVLDHAGTERLYFHESSGQDEVLWSVGSSLLEYKGNVDRAKFVDVPIVDLGEFIASLKGRVKVLKLDVEGVEVPILKKLIETGLIDRIDYVFAETHDAKIPELREETNSLRGMIRARKLKHVNLDWT